MSLKDIIKQIELDKRNAEYTNKNIPPILQVDKEARILIVGQAPGKKVEESLIPFNDKSGETLISWMGIDKDTFYSKEIAIVPMDFYYPGKAKTGDLPPRKFIAQEYHEPILKELNNIELTILIGKYSMDYYLKGRTKKNLTETVKCFDEYLPKYFPIVHPSPLNFRWQAKNPWFVQDVVPVLKKTVKKILK
ncbi:MAG: uracil-DNA glycosylase family protein [[Eubacterium] sulci]|nr:uracil-DNA glycosylase family protein [[Eubacterium] sulci]